MVSRIIQSKFVVSNLENAKVIDVHTDIVGLSDCVMDFD